MARNGIQYRDVKQAIDELMRQGDTPSVQRIRDVLGTGSFTTISEHFRHWRQERAHNTAPPASEGVPDAIMSTASELWRQAQEVAHQELVDCRKEAEKSVAQAHQAAEEEKQRARNAQQRESALAEHLRHIEEQLGKATSALAQAETHAQHWKTESQRHALNHEQVSELLKEQHLKTESMETHHKAELEQLQQHLDKQLAQEQQRHEASEARWMGLLDSTRQERANEQKVLNKKLHHQEERLEKLSTSLKQAQQLNQDLKASLAIAEQSLKKKSQSLEEYHHQIAHLDAQLTTARQEQNYWHQQYSETLNRQDDQWQKDIIDSVQALQSQMMTLPSRMGANNASQDEDAGAQKKPDNGCS